MVGKRVAGLFGFGVLLGASLGCQQVIDSARSELWSQIQANPGKINDMGEARQAMDNLVPALVSALKQGTPAPPTEDEVEAIVTEYVSKKGGDDWVVPPGDTMSERVSPAPAEIPIEKPPAPGE